MSVMYHGLSKAFLYEYSRMTLTLRRQAGCLRLGPEAVPVLLVLLEMV